jgi:hypothetical protein
VLQTHGTYLFDALNAVRPERCRLIIIGPPSDVTFATAPPFVIIPHPHSHPHPHPHPHSHSHPHSHLRTYTHIILFIAFIS